MPTCIICGKSADIFLSGCHIKALTAAGVKLLQERPVPVEIAIGYCVPCTNAVERKMNDVQCESFMKPLTTQFQG